MPLFKKKSMSEMEMPAKPKGDSLPIAYGVQKAQKKKKFAYGGKAEADANPGTPARKPDDSRPPKGQFMSGDNDIKANDFVEMIASDGRPSLDSMQDGMSVAERIRRKRMMAEGGMVPADDAETEKSMDDMKRKKDMSFSDDEGMSMDALKKENYAEGGMVDLDANDEESPNQYDKMNRKAADAHQYDDSQISPQPMDSNEHGHMIEDEMDRSIVAAIRRKMSGKKM